MSYSRLHDPAEEYPLSQLPQTHAPSTISISEPSIYSTNTSLPRNTNQRAGSSMVSRMKRGPGMQAIFSYAPDWVLCIVLAAIFFALDKVEGFKREFSLTDTSLLHPYAIHERVPAWALYIIFAAAPLVLMPIINVLTVRSVWDFHSSWLGWLLSASITGAITQFSKITVGRPRPDVVSRCQPPPGSVDPALGLSTVAICTQLDLTILDDGWRSFPSGHSSLSFAGLGFLSFYLAGKLHLFDERGHTIKAWLALSPLSGAALVAISRTMDYRHHWQDVLTGSILGLVVAYFAYRQYYPPLNSDLSHVPYPPRYKRGGQELPTHTNDISDPQSVPFENIGMRPRQTDRRYSDRPSIGDEELGGELPQRPTSVRNAEGQKEP